MADPGEPMEDVKYENAAKSGISYFPSSAYSPPHRLRTPDQKRDFKRLQISDDHKIPGPHLKTTYNLERKQHLLAKCKPNGMQRATTREGSKILFSSRFEWQQSHKTVHSNQSLLLDLPRELRDHIYECCVAIQGVIAIRGSQRQWDPVRENFYALDDSGGSNSYSVYVPVSYSQRPHPVPSPETDEAAYIQLVDQERRLTRSKLSDPCVKKMAPVLLRTCKQIHYEAAEVLYRHIFEFSQPCGSFSKVQALSITALSGTYATMLKTIRFHFWWMSFYNTRNTWQQFCEQSWGGFKQLQSMYPNLHKLQIVMAKRGRPYPWEPEGTARHGEHAQFTRNPRIITKKRLENRLFVWFANCFAMRTVKVPDQIDFVIEDENVDEQVVSKAWGRFKERNNALLR